MRVGVLTQRCSPTPLDRVQRSALPDRGTGHPKSQSSNGAKTLAGYESGLKPVALGAPQTKIDRLDVRELPQLW